MKSYFRTVKFYGCCLVFSCAALFVLGFCASFFCPPFAYSAQVTLAWNANTEPTLAGYKIYYGQASRTYGDPVNVGNQTTYALTLPDLPDGGAYYFAATAYDTSGNESDFSEELVCYAISAEAGPNGTITPGGVFLTEKGSGQTFTITPAAGYHIADVLVNGSSVGPVSSYTFTDMQSNQSISASFLPDIVTYTITASAGANGAISPSGTVTVNHGESKTFTITPSA
ncbi:MAG: fibronectin type III domain-containing protein, partial [Deltaproteobacteria bacterium]|nr:fibronectin type III domain-containing protein [Deltaproteobacteria bacterium]